MKNFGQSISGSNTNIVAICDGDNTYIHELVNDEWTITQTIRNIGSSVSISKDNQWLAIASYQEKIINIYINNNNQFEESITNIPIAQNTKIRISKNNQNEYKLFYSSSDTVFEFDIDSQTISDTVSIPKKTTIGYVKLENEITSWNISDDGLKLVLSYIWIVPEYDENLTFDSTVNLNPGLVDDTWSTLTAKSVDGITTLFEKQNQKFTENLGFIRGAHVSSISGNGQRIAYLEFSNLNYLYLNNIDLNEGVKDATITVVQKSGDRFTKIGRTLYLKVAPNIFNYINPESHDRDLLALDYNGNKLIQLAGSGAEGITDSGGGTIFFYKQALNQWTYSQTENALVEGSIDPALGMLPLVFFNQEYLISSNGIEISIERVTELNRQFLGKYTIYIGDNDWTQNESYSFRPINFSQIIDSDKQSPVCINSQSEFLTDNNLSEWAWDLNSIYSAETNPRIKEDILDDSKSPYGSVYGDYEFVNINNIESKWKKELIYRSTLNNRYEYNCLTRNTGKCRPQWADQYRPQNSSDPFEMEYMFGKELIFKNYIIQDINNTTSSFKHHIENTFWLLFQQLCKQYSKLCVLSDYQSRQALSLCDINKGSAGQFNVIEKYRFSPSLINFIKTFNMINLNEVDINISNFDNSTYMNFSPRTFNNTNLTNEFIQEIENLEANDVLQKIPYNEVDSRGYNFIRNLSILSSSGGDNPYIGYNEDGHVVERELICTPIKRENNNQRIDYIHVLVKWSISYVDPLGSKMSPPVFSMYYNIDETFTYRGIEHGVYDNFPFLDFNMTPIPWNKV